MDLILDLFQLADGIDARRHMARLARHPTTSITSTTNNLSTNTPPTTYPSCTRPARYDTTAPTDIVPQLAQHTDRNQKTHHGDVRRRIRAGGGGRRDPADG